MKSYLATLRRNRYQAQYMRRYRKFLSLKKDFGSRFSLQHLKRMAGLIPLALVLLGCKAPSPAQVYYDAAVKTNSLVDMYHWPAPNPVLPPLLPKIKLPTHPRTTNITSKLRSIPGDGLLLFTYPTNCAQVKSWTLQQSSNLSVWTDLQSFQGGCPGPTVLSLPWEPGQWFFRMKGNL